MDLFNPVDHRLVVKWLQDVIICTQVKYILRHFFLTDRRNHDERRLFQILILIDTVHHGESVKLWHNDIQQHNIRLLLTNNLNQFFSVSSFSNHLQLLIAAHDVVQHLQHDFVIISNRDIQFVHTRTPLPKKKC